MSSRNRRNAGKRVSVARRVIVKYWRRLAAILEDILSGWQELASVCRSIIAKDTPQIRCSVIPIGGYDETACPASALAFPACPVLAACRCSEGTQIPPDRAESDNGLHHENREEVSPMRLRYLRQSKIAISVKHVVSLGSIVCSV